MPFQAQTHSEIFPDATFFPYGMKKSRAQTSLDTGR
ncbi:hypothetical protein EVA_09289 [gut metagenome]|uniref:Uncharacterized protein n=1 Tax=gut metagenome TaxID=749906 RepID=J9GKI3_9ZZZZ